MTKELFNYLEEVFYQSNIKKYHKYFKEWADNLTNSQLEGFENQRIGSMTHSKHL